MNESIKNEQWVWIIVQDPGKDEQFLGQYDEENDTSFIPVFLKKEDALQGMNLLKRDIFKTYEAQAIIYEDLLNESEKKNFKLFILSSKGEILEKIPK